MFKWTKVQWAAASVLAFITFGVPVLLGLLAGWAAGVFYFILCMAVNIMCYFDREK